MRVRERGFLLLTRRSPPPRFLLLSLLSGTSPPLLPARARNPRSKPPSSAYRKSDVPFLHVEPFSEMVLKVRAYAVKQIPGSLGSVPQRLPVEWVFRRGAQIVGKVPQDGHRPGTAMRLSAGSTSRAYFCPHPQTILIGIMSWPVWVRVLNCSPR